MIPYLLRGTPPFYFRLYGSFAAPTFIFLSGMMVSFTITKKNHSSIYFVKRTVTLLITGAALDLLISGILPFMTFDVLYLIGLSILLTFFFKKLKRGMQYITTLIIFAFTPVLQNIFGYQRMPVEIPISMIGSGASIPITTVLRQLFIDGWFPLFPWLGFAFLGSIAADIRFKAKSFSNLAVLFAGLITLIFGELIWTAHPGSLYIRKGYSELFYPPTTGFILTSIGVIIILFFIIDLKNSLAIFKPFSVLGRWSLQIYVLHLILIFLLGKLTGPLDMNIFLLIYFAIVMIILGLSTLIDKFKGLNNS